jgi:hypothetical protein
MSASEQDMADQCHFQVSEEKMKAFLAAHGSTPQPKPRMKRLFVGNPASLEKARMSKKSRAKREFPTFSSVEKLSRTSWYPSFPGVNPYWMSGFENTLSQTSEAVYGSNLRCSPGNAGCWVLRYIRRKRFQRTLFQQELQKESSQPSDTMALLPD